MWCVGLKWYVVIFREKKKKTYNYGWRACKKVCVCQPAEQREWSEQLGNGLLSYDTLIGVLFYGVEKDAKRDIFM